MEQDSSNGSRTSVGGNPGAATASTSEGGERGDGSVDVLARSNQEEEDDGGSAYGSGDFDELSKAGGSESEYDSRDYGLDEDDRSSNDSSPTTGDGSASYTTGTGTKGEGEGTAGAAVVGGATPTAELDERNSLSSYGDDFAEDEDSVVPPATTQAADTRRASSGGLSSDFKNVADSDKKYDHQVDQQERVGSSLDHAAAPVASSSPSPASEGGAKGPTSSSGSYSRSASNEAGSARTGKKIQERRRSSASNESKNKNSRNSGGETATTIGKASGGAAQVDNGVESGAFPSAHKLEERLREADVENARLREALEKSAAAAGAATAAASTGQTAGGEDVARELEILKSQVEAAR